MTPVGIAFTPNIMPILYIILILCLVGVLLWGISKVPFILPQWKTVIYWVAAILVAIWLLDIIGLWKYLLEPRVPSLR